MAEVIEPIASAVIVPPEIPKSPISSAKRRQSSGSESSSKRLKGDGETKEAMNYERRPSIQAETTTSADKNARADWRKSSVQEERKRGQRLFGGLLSTLSQSTTNGQQKRRQEIEKRQQEKAKQQKAEDEGRRARKLKDLKIIREAEQIKFDAVSMRMRHSNSLAMAHFLTTRTEPKLYYKPWELLPRQVELIKDQVADAEANIEREKEVFYARHPQATGGCTSTRGEDENMSKETVGEPGAEPSSVSKVVDTTNDTLAQMAEPDQVMEKQASEEHNGEVVVENEEDIVIY